MSDSQQSISHPEPSQHSEVDFCLLPNVEWRAGDLCPRCGQAKLDYDGLLNLSCPVCRFMLAGCST